MHLCCSAAERQTPLHVAFEATAPHSVDMLTLYMGYNVCLTPIVALIPHFLTVEAMTASSHSERHEEGRKEERIH